MTDGPTDSPRPVEGGAATPGPVAAAGGPAPPPWGWAGWLLVAAAFAAGFANFPMRVVGWRLDHLPGDSIDPRLNNYVLEHGYRYLAGREASFWDAPVFYPAPAAIAGSDAHIGMLPLYAALRAAGLPPERAFQGWFLIPFLLNYAAAVWALRRLGAGPAGCAAGGLVFTFALSVSGQILHAQLFPRFLVPVAVVFAWDFLREPRTWRLAVVAACWTAQTYVSVYTGYFLAFLLATGCALVALRYGRRLPWRELLWPGWAASLARVAVVAAAVTPVLLLAERHGRVAYPLPPEEFEKHTPDPETWLTQPSVGGPVVAPQDVTRAGHTAAEFEERELFPGFVPLLALGAGLLAVFLPGRFGGRGSAAAVAAWASLLLALLVTRYGAHWPYEPLTGVPGTRGIRAVGRVVLVLLFPAGVAVAAGVDLLVTAAGRAGRVPAAAVALVLVAATASDQWLTPTDGPRHAAWAPMRYPLATALAKQRRIADAVRRRPGAALVYVHDSVSPTPPGGNRTMNLVSTLQLEAMRACQDLGVPTVNGWSGYLPPGWNLFRGYRDLLDWLTVRHHAAPDRVAGLLLVGTPEPDPDPRYEARMRATHPPEPLTPGP